MKRFLNRGLPVCVMVVLFAVSCATTKTVHTWKDETYNKKLESVLVIGVAEVDFMRSHFENVLSMRLAEHGVKAVASNTVFTDATKKLDREAVAAKIKELGIGSVLVGRTVSKAEKSQMIVGDYYEVPVIYSEGWYNAYASPFVPVTLGGAVYDAEYFDMLINVYDSSSQKLVWSELLRVKVEQSRQAAINPFIDLLVRNMESSRLISGTR